MKYYDCIFSLGEACFIAIHLKKNGLRMFSGPFDWMYGSSFKIRCDIFASKFEEYFNKNDLEFKEYRELNKMVTYRNKKTDIHYNHDFHSDVPFDYEYPFIKEKYDRRINRLLKKISNSKRVLVCYGDLADTQRGAKSDIEIIECVKKLNDVYAPAQIDMLYIKHNKNMKDGEVKYSIINSNITIAECYSQNRCLDNFLGNDETMKSLFKNIQLSKQHRFKFHGLLNKLYKIKETKKGLKLKVCGITILKFKNPLILEYYKKKYVLEQKENITTIALGSSHGNRGFNSMFMSEPTVNLCTTSQDLYQSYQMFVYALKNCFSIKNVIVFYSPFSSGFNISCSSEKYRTAFMKTVFGINPYQNDKTISSHFYKKPSNLFMRNLNIKSDNNPLFENEDIVEEDVKKRAQKHISYADNTNMNEYLIKIIELAKEKTINIFIVIPPYAKIYKKYMSPTIFSSLDFICSKYDVSYFIFYNDNDFIDNDFADADHLNIFGSIKLTKKIDEILKAKK